ncbi:MAG: ATP-binding protein [Dehalococcoidia bacterium]
MTWKQIIPGVFYGTPDQANEGEAVNQRQKGEEAELRVRLSNIPPETLTTHRLWTWEHKANEPWWPKIEAYAHGDYEHPFLTLLGTPGTGKTHIAFAIAWEWLKRGAGVLYYQVEDLLDALRHGYTLWEKGATDSYDRILEFTRHANLLILDDLGAHNETEWAVVKLDQIVDYRYVHKQPLIATTNMALNRLPARIGDRLTEGLLIHLTGESYRKNKKSTDNK